MRELTPYLFLGICVLVASKEVKDPCQHSTGNRGICKRWSECPEIHKKPFRICKYEIPDMIVCCPDISLLVQDLGITTEYTITESPAVVPSQVAEEVTEVPEVTKAPEDILMGERPSETTTMAPEVSIARPTAPLWNPADYMLYTTPAGPKVIRTLPPELLAMLAMPKKLPKLGSLFRPTEGPLGFRSMTNKAAATNVSDQVIVWPWMVSLGNRTAISDIFDIFCGGALIQLRVVITTASCTAKSPDVVRLGVAEMLDVVAIQKVITYEGFNELNLKDDLALVILERESRPSPFVQPVGLIVDGTEIPLEGEHNIILTGLGYFNDVGNGYAFIHGAIDIMDRAQCNKRLADTSMFSKGIHDNYICSVEPDYFKTHCENGEGSPLVYRKNEHENILVGVLSWKEKCDNKPAPFVFTNVMKYGSWIQKHLLL